MVLWRHFDTGWQMVCNENLRYRELWDSLTGSWSEALVQESTR